MEPRRLRRLVRWIVALVAAAIVGALVVGVSLDASAVEMTNQVIDWE